MYEYIKGTLTESTPLKAVVETGGVGYGIHIPLSAYSKLPQLGKQVMLYLSYIVREDSQKFYGFLTQEERSLFEKVLEVSGIGPKTALALVGHLEVADLHMAIADGNVSLLSKVPGIGKKTAERLMVEMRDKVKNLPLPVTGAGLPAEKGVASDAISALINLGYNPLQARKAIQAALAGAKEEPPLAQLITSALRQL
jgi:Holliday junction DNA helicase, RuvA subunit